MPGQATAQAAGLPPATAASAPTPQKIEVTGGRESDTEQRRQATAAKIVIGREELDRFGDSTVGEVLKRLPGVTTGGPPGRGGSPRMRGLGAGYTQILIDGQRVPPGFSLDSLTPDQIERIEILRAPTAETGARAIGGTINIITREGYKRRINELRVGAGYENGQTTPGLFWTRNDSVGDLTYTLAAGAFRNKRATESSTRTTETQLADGTLQRDQLETSRGLDTRIGLNFNSRLQWRLGGSDSLLLMPVLFHSQGDSRSRYELAQSWPEGPSLGADPSSDSRFTVARLNLNWRTTLGAGQRLELNAGGSSARGHSQGQRFVAVERRPDRLSPVDERSVTRDRTALLNAKLSQLLDNDHSLVAGFEVEALRRGETYRSDRADTPAPGEGAALVDAVGDLQASSLRLAGYAQDEWAISPQWAAHAGLRWESIATRGDAGSPGTTANRSRVLTPLMHAVWKPDPKARDQLRLSLTRSYKSPTLQNLVARRRPSTGINSETNPDRAGNPDLRPELATGVDVAIERYLPQGGVLSANLFHRRITDYIRAVIDQGTDGRFTSRPENVGRALTQGIELEAKFRLDQLIDGAAPVELRNNLSLFRSRVEGVPGPDNRLDEQPRATANIGADYRLRGMPLKLGGSLNLTPGYRTQVSTTQQREAGAKRQFDAYALWIFDPAAQLRLLASNLSAADYTSSNAVDAAGLRTQALTVTPTHVNWQLRLELKL